MSQLETCCACECPTGRAGRGEDSLYVGDEGPYCETCFQEVSLACFKLAQVKALNQRSADAEPEPPSDFEVDQKIDDWQRSHDLAKDNPKPRRT